MSPRLGTMRTTATRTPRSPDLLPLHAPASAGRFVGEHAGEAARGGGHGERRRQYGPAGQVEPLLLAVGHGRQAHPLEYPFLLVVEVEDDEGRLAIAEVNTALPALPDQAE